MGDSDVCMLHFSHYFAFSNFKVGDCLRFSKSDVFGFLARSWSKTVFIEQPYLPEGVSREYFRWLYTALTRAQEKLYLIGFKDDFFND